MFIVQATDYFTHIRTSSAAKKPDQFYKSYWSISSPFNALLILQKSLGIINWRGTLLQEWLYLIVSYLIVDKVLLSERWPDCELKETLRYLLKLAGTQSLDLSFLQKSLTVDNQYNEMLSNIEHYSLSSQIVKKLLICPMYWPAGLAPREPLLKGRTQYHWPLISCLFCWKM